MDCPVCYTNIPDLIICENSHALCYECYTTMMSGDRSQNKKCAECRVPMFDWQNDGTIDPVIADRPNPRWAQYRADFANSMRSAIPAGDELRVFRRYDGCFPWTDEEGATIRAMITAYNTTYPQAHIHYLWEEGDRHYSMGRIGRFRSPHRQAELTRQDEARRRAQREARNARRRAQRQAHRAGQPAPAGTRVRHCSCCGNTGHDRRTCPQR